MKRFVQRRWSLLLVIVLLAVAGPTLYLTAEEEQPSASSVTVEGPVAETLATAAEDAAMLRTCSLNLAPLESLPAKVRGSFVGAIGNVLVVAGGAPEVGASAMVDSTFADDIYYLNQDVKDATWVKSSAKLPAAAGFGASATGNGKLYCIGGFTSDGVTANIVELKWDGDAKDVIVNVNEDAVGSLPVPLAFAGAKVMGEKLYVAGGITSAQSQGQDLSDRLSDKLFECELPKTGGWGSGIINMLKQMLRGDPPQRPRAGEWKDVAKTPVIFGEGEPLAGGALNPLLGVRRDELAGKDALYVMGGRTWNPQTSRFEIVRAAWRYIPGNINESRAGWARVKDLPAGLVPWSGVPIGPAHLMAFVETDAQPVGDLPSLARLFGGNSFYMYHVYTDTWTDMAAGEHIRGGEVFQLGESFVWMGVDEMKSIVSLEQGKLQYNARHFGTVDFLVLASYILGMIWIGGYFSRKEKSTEEYFVGGRKIPWWAAGLSIYATGVSAISFMAIPAKTFMTDWSYIALGMFPPITTYIAAIAFVPLLRRLQIMTMPEYLELRFHKVIRTIASVLMVIGQVGGRMSITLLLPSLALTAVTGWNVYYCIVFMGVLATIYTVLGGISAVIWTDVVQVFVMFGGAILSFFIIVANIDGGFAGMVTLGTQASKFRSFDFSPDLTVATFWVFTIWAIGDLFGRIGQESMQRAFATKNVKSAKSAMLTCAAVSIPGTLLFYALGTALYAYYNQHPQELNPTLMNDGTFPLFIAQKLPVGIAGLVIAGLFAAAMSTLDSAMNSVSTVVVRDWFSVFSLDATEKVKVFVARVITVVVGVMGTLMALYLVTASMPSLWDTFSKIMSLIGGGFGGVIVLGLLTRRSNTAGALVGSVVGTVMLLMLEVYSGETVHLFGASYTLQFSFFMYGTMAMTVSVLLGYFTSLIWPSEPKDLTGLTVWTPSPNKEQPETVMENVHQ